MTSQMSMFCPTNTDKGFSVDISEWEYGGFPDPLTARTVYGWKRFLKAELGPDGEIACWYGTLPSGARLVVWND
jgi:hypothetical protein